ncbi:hypothetical protein G7085_14885 [Tessaracoccus sp. HDW20]|uniref:hypothetical protein n=1 Tax=Tessaracoccus coleopterorum TaxID=2714950 RepID=UPI0018D2D4F0|nr:hypothetical protein [Tessaracoccus coleopterorum]NHB85467.1 hypothetical protein [Tessaracoccus coleopterorum]
MAYLPRSDDELETPGALQTAVGLLGSLADGAEISVKPSSLGLRSDEASAAARLEDLCATARSKGPT